MSDKQEKVKTAPSHWAKDSEEEDRVEALIKKTGCWDAHIAVVNCMSEKSDWRKCQDQVLLFKNCVANSQKKPTEIKN